MQPNGYARIISKNLPWNVAINFQFEPLWNFQKEIKNYFDSQNKDTLVPCHSIDIKINIEKKSSTAQ
jgi:hypothetical protein